MNTDFIKGVVVPILTPIDAMERIDEARLRDQVDYVINGGVSGILPSAVTENSTWWKKTRWSEA